MIFKIVEVVFFIHSFTSGIWNEIVVDIENLWNQNTSPKKPKLCGYKLYLKEQQATLTEGRKLKDLSGPYECCYQK